MQSSLRRTKRDDGLDIYYDPDFIRMIESHLGLLRRDASTTLMPVPERHGWKNEGDLAGLLTAMDVPRFMHHIVMRVNNMRSNEDFLGTETVLRVPSSQVIEKLRSRYITEKRTLMTSGQ